MPLNYPEKGNHNGKFLVPAGSHIALCNMVVDLGMQPGNGIYPEPKYQLFVRWELPFEIVEYEKDGKKLKGPRVIGKTYTASMGKKANLRKDLEAWRGKAFTDGEASKFDIGSILGKGCMINVVHKEKEELTYANIVGVSGLPKGTAMPSFSVRPIYYAPDDKTLYDELPDWLRKKIDTQIKVGGELAQGDPTLPPVDSYNPTEGGSDDDIPF